MAMITADPKDVPHVAHFAFMPDSLAKAKALMANYPPGRQASAVIAVLDLAQRQQGWLPRVAMDEVAKLLDMAPIRVYEIATFYTMFQLKPRGKYLLQVCTTTPCWLRGSEAVMKACQHAADGEIFSVQEVECLGGCVNARAGLERRAGKKRAQQTPEDYCAPGAEGDFGAAAVHG